MKKLFLTIISRAALIYIFILALFVFTAKASAELAVKANHDHIKIASFYHGSTVSVAGVADSGADLIIKLTSPEGHETLRKKGKAAGFLWMNVGSLNFERVPNLYFLHTTKKLEEMLTPDEIDKYLIGYPALEKHVEITPIKNEDEKTKWFNDFVKFKESSKLYSTSYGKISTTVKDGKQHYYVLLDWPYQALPDNYTVTVYAVKDKKIVETATASVFVEQVGIVKTLSDMAKNNGVMYGIISIAIALAAGFGVGIIFRKGGGSH